MHERRGLELAATTQDLGCAIAHLRGNRTQAALAQSCGLTPASWSLYEHGKRKPMGANLAKIVRGLGCTQLELEELAWRFRRRRLAAETPPRAWARGPSSPRHPVPILPGHGLPPPESGAPGSLRGDLETLWKRLGPLVEDFARLLERAIARQG